MTKTVGVEREYIWKLGIKFDPSQPRVSAGVPEGGEWTAGEPSAEIRKLADSPMDSITIYVQMRDRTRKTQVVHGGEFYTMLSVVKDQPGRKWDPLDKAWYVDEKAARAIGKHFKVSDAKEWDKHRSAVRKAQDRISAWQAKKKATEQQQRWESTPATSRQMDYLKILYADLGYDATDIPKGLTMAQASFQIDMIKSGEYGSLGLEDIRPISGLSEVYGGEA